MLPAKRLGSKVQRHVLLPLVLLSGLHGPVWPVLAIPQKLSQTGGREHGMQKAKTFGSDEVCFLTVVSHFVLPSAAGDVLLEPRPSASCCKRSRCEQ